tara:strand:+ start:70640 stop:71176 length:537 start_codon:yes stop_codon:yes gene_type:complete
MAPIVSPEQANEWFIGKARTLEGIRENIVHSTERATSHAALGRMYFFRYDPKFKEVLPIYDRFPLVLPIERYKGGFLGLNIHYLDYPQNKGFRKKLLDQLKENATNLKYDETTRVKMSYTILKSMTMMKLAKPTIHRYLMNHVRSRFIEIHMDEWDKVAVLKVQDFVTKKKKNKTHGN